MDMLISNSKMGDSLNLFFIATIQNIFYNLNSYYKLKMLETDEWSKVDTQKRSYEGSLFQGLKQGMGMETINHSEDDAE
jgi:hypothetical protein